MVLERLVTAIDELAGLDPADLTGPEIFAQLHRQLDRLEARPMVVRTLQRRPKWVGSKS